MDALREAAEADHLIGPLVDRLAEKATAKWKTLSTSPTNKRLSIVLVGFRYERLPRPYCFLVSNYEDLDGGTSGQATERFRVHWARHGAVLTEGFHVASFGWTKAVNDEELESLADLVKRQIPAEGIVGKALNLLQDAATRSEGIGRRASSIVLPADPQANAIVNYHPAASSTRLYLPNMVISKTGLTIAMKGHEQWVNEGEPPLALPRAKRNDPCPCGSGKKFKRCHGR